MKYQIEYIRFNQTRQELLLAVMPFRCIDTFSQVLVYGQDKGGYQRKPEPKHFNKIRDYILNNTKDFILPTSVILGLDNDELGKLGKDVTGKKYLNFDSDKITQKVFRIIDGQHRIYGLREAAKKDKAIYEFMVPVVVLITNKNKRSIELSIFNDINSKAKRVKVDLIKLAEFDYRVMEKSINEKNIVEHISIKAAFILKESRENSVWHNAIKFDIHNELVLGIIGVNSFMESIQVLVRVYLKEHRLDLNLDHESILKYVDKAGLNISDFLFTCWDDYIRAKWPDAFGGKQIGIDLDEELKTFYYKKDYYIQKTFGVKALNGLIGDIYRKWDGVANKSLANVKSRISDSSISNNHWKVGGPFAGLSSESGVNKVKQSI